MIKNNLGKTLWLHVGYPKTATTHLQEHFFPHISKDKICYIGKRVSTDSMSFDVAKLGHWIGV